MPLGTPKQRAVLAVLVMSRNRPVGIDSLITAAWEQWPPPEAQGQPALLRLEPAQAAPATRRSMLDNAPPGYRLDGRRRRLRHRPIRPREDRGRAGRRGGPIRGGQRAPDDAALAEWRGPVLEDLRDFQFVDAFATALTEDKVVAHTARAEAEIACRRGYAVIGELESLTVEHPYREPLWAQLITAYYLAERQSEALDAYQRLKTTLADDLGIDPGPTVRALHERILRQEPLDVKKGGKTTAVHTSPQHRPAHRRSTHRPLRQPAGIAERAGSPRWSAAATRIGRPQRQRHRARRRQRQPPPRRHHRHRHQFRDHRSALGQRCRRGRRNAFAAPRH